MKKLKLIGKKFIKPIPIPRFFYHGLGYIAGLVVCHFNGSSFASKTNRAVFFPSWLQHWVPQNISEKNRISIAWNVQLKGEVGEHNEYQSATF